jgi:vacuolar-type H+-ATPase subunit H
VIAKREAEEILENGEKFIEKIAQHLKEKKIL